MSGLGPVGVRSGGGAFAVNCSLIEYRVHCQPDKRRRSKCKEFF
jgi:hypothetical protein